MITVEVNEAKIFATRAGATWWALYRSRRPGIRDVTVSPGGNLVHVDCDDRDHADWPIGTCTAAGIPATALRVREVTA